jgi:hypothetical protein
MSPFPVLEMLFALLTRSKISVISLAIGIGILSGCNPGPTMYQVSGHVHYKDGSVPHGAVAVVCFQPSTGSDAKIRKGASAAIDPTDGSFKLWTRTGNDGVYPGEYSVGFTVLKSTMDPKPLVLDKYSQPNTSGFSETVDRNRNDLEYVIEPAAGTNAK